MGAFILKDLFNKQIKIGATCAISANYLNDRKLVRGTVVSIDKQHCTVEYIYIHSFKHVYNGTVNNKEMIYRVRRFPEDIVVV